MQKRKYFIAIIILTLLYGIVQALSGSVFINITTDGGSEGAFFNVTALSEPIRITGFEATIVGTTNVRVYYRAGGYAGFENTSAAWTLLGSQATTGGTGFIQTLYPINVGSVVIPAGQTYGFLMYSGFAGSGVLSVRVRFDTSATASDSYINVFADTTSIGGNNLIPFDGSSAGRIWRGVVHYETIEPSSSTTIREPYQFRDGRINRFDLAAPFVVFPHPAENNELGLVFYDAYNANTLLLAVSAEQIAAVEKFPAVNTLIATSGDGRVALYRLTDGRFQATGSTQNGKTYLLIFSEISSSITYTSSEE